MRELDDRMDRVRHRLRQPLARTPLLYDALIALRPSKRSDLARADTSIVVEGFLRSGNTFSVAALSVANGPELRIASHLHAPAHVHRAVRLGLPTIVVIRHPADATVSYLVRRPTLTVDAALREYIAFYRSAWRVRHGFVIAPFDVVTSDFAVIVRALNARFGTTFAEFAHTPQNEALAFGLVDEMNRAECRGELVETHVGRPSAVRAELTADLLRGLDDPRAAALLADARRLHDRYVAAAAADIEAVPLP